MTADQKQFLLQVKFVSTANRVHRRRVGCFSTDWVYIKLLTHIPDWHFKKVMWVSLKKVVNWWLIKFVDVLTLQFQGKNWWKLSSSNFTFHMMKTAFKDVTSIYVRNSPNDRPLKWNRAAYKFSCIYHQFSSDLNWTRQYLLNVYRKIKCCF